MRHILIIFVGISVSCYAYFNYNIGEPSHMGPGFFPFYLGIILAVIGTTIFLATFNKKFLPKKLNYKKLIIIISSIILFSTTLNTLGILLSTFLSSLLSTYANKNYINNTSRIIVALTITLITWIVFILFLDVPIKIFPGIIT